MQIRDRRDDDLEQLVALAAQVHEADQYPVFLPGGDLEGFLTAPQPLAAWVAVGRRDRVIGHVALHVETSQPVMRLAAGLMPERPIVYLARLLVHPHDRRKGLGRMLLEHARRAAIESGHFPILDVVDTPTAAAAIALYRREGWEEIGRVNVEIDDAQVDELVFRAPLVSRRTSTKGPTDSADVEPS